MSFRCMISRLSQQAINNSNFDWTYYLKNEVIAMEYPNFSLMLMKELLMSFKK